MRNYNSKYRRSTASSLLTSIFFPFPSWSPFSSSSFSNRVSSWNLVFTWWKRKNLTLHLFPNNFTSRKQNKISVARGYNKDSYFVAEVFDHWRLWQGPSAVCTKPPQLLVGPQQGHLVSTYEKKGRWEKRKVLWALALNLTKYLLVRLVGRGI